jgi:hypothetical protein
MTDSKRKYIPSGMPSAGHQVTPERLEELRRIYKEVSGEEITTAEASEMSHRLLALYKLLAQHLPGEAETPSPSPPPPAQSAPGGV